MKRVLALLLLLQLACMTSAVIVSPRVDPAPPTAVQPGATALDASQCARVIAAQSLHVRDADMIVIDYLYHGDEVEVLDSSGDWWLVRTADIGGRVRSRYLGVCDER